MNLYRHCFSELKRQLAQKGFELKAEKITAARLVEAARGPGKDDDTSFTKKGKKTVYGYKDHVAIDPKSDFVSEFVCTPANVHDSQVLDELGDEKTIFADKAYDSEEIRQKYREEGKFCGILAKACRGPPLSGR